MWHVGSAESKFPEEGLNPHSLRWKLGVLTTRPPRRSLKACLCKEPFFLFLLPSILPLFSLDLSVQYELNSVSIRFQGVNTLKFFLNKKILFILYWGMAD